MLAGNVKAILKFGGISYSLLRNSFSTSAIRCLDQKWRQDNGLNKNPNTYGALTDRPDYTFLDGRPTPYGVRQKLRMEKQKEIAEKIITMSNEIDFAVERHQQSEKREEERKQNIIKNKLKPKGILLLKKS